MITSPWSITLTVKEEYRKCEKKNEKFVRTEKSRGYVKSFNAVPKTEYLVAKNVSMNIVS